MKSRFALGSALLVIIFSIGGCPTDPNTNPDLSGPSDNASATDAVATTPSTAGVSNAPIRDDMIDDIPLATAAGAPDFDAALAREFPDCEDPARAADWEDEILRLVNLERGRNGLNTLSRNETLEDQASQYACEMITYDFFAHVNPVTASTLADRASEFKYKYHVIGENLAGGQLTPEQAFQDWMESPGHRANILDPRFTEIGIAVKAGGSYGFYWVQEFGQPR